MKINIKYNLLIGLICIIIIVYHTIYSAEIITHPYMFLSMCYLYGFGGYHLGVAFAKLLYGES